jgi:hypothetical protein
MKFITKLYHPNVSSASGAICLDLLKDAWSPVLTLKSTMISLQSLLSSPEPSDPQDAEVAKHYMTSREGFDETARYWAEIYAGAPPRERKEGDSSAAGAGEEVDAGAAAKESKKSEKAKAKEPVIDEVAAAGLNPAHVQQFETLGFERRKVVSITILSSSSSYILYRLRVYSYSFTDRSLKEIKLSRIQHRQDHRGSSRREALIVTVADAEGGSSNNFLTFFSLSRVNKECNSSCIKYQS